jgi:hypothetical protein
VLTALLGVPVYFVFVGIERVELFGDILPFVARLGMFSE